MPMTNIAQHSTVTSAGHQPAVSQNPAGPFTGHGTSRIRVRPQQSLLGMKALCASVAFAASSLAAYAAGVTAVPPAPGLGTVPALSAPPPAIGTVNFSAAVDDIKAFNVIGFLQNASVSDANCSGLPASQWGGSAIVNGLTIVIPCNTTLQMPAATFTWADLFDPTKFETTLSTPASLELPSAGGPGTGRAFNFPSTEVNVLGNIVAGRYIAGLVFISQQSLNTGVGYITGFDYESGVIYVGGRKGADAQTRLQLNDPRGRFSKGQSADTRFAVDDENPTIRAATGYPMCIPRADPTTKADDPRCPKRNRPRAPACRNFAAANVALPSRQELTAPAAGQIYCSSFVMGDPATAGSNDPISSEQAPFQIGDFIQYSGTLLRGDSKGPGGSDTISVHTIEANVGIYTEPGTLPVYLAITSASVSAEAPRIFNNIPQEAPDRLVLEAVVTDVTSIVDIYLVDLDTATRKETQRWITPASMTSGIGSWGSNNEIIDGGITTQFTGPVPGRVRIRANRATPGILYSPTRYMRVAARQLCDPANINGLVIAINRALPVGVRRPMVPCLIRATAANGLKSGQYLAPTVNFLFPEAIVPGDPTVPNNFWGMGFLVNGEGPGTGPLMPTPW